jgi:hypothetical protein
MGAVVLGIQTRLKKAVAPELFTLSVDVKLPRDARRKAFCSL